MSKPRISIVTVSLNQAETIAATLESVLAQRAACAENSNGDGADWLEHIVIDGGSTDGTREIIESYDRQLTYWVSEPDRGQSHALNKGFARATGDVVGWLNADDLLMPGALCRVRELFDQLDCDVLCGQCRYEFPDGRIRVEGVTRRDIDMLHVHDPIHQPSCFWRRNWHRRMNGLNESLHYGMDWDLYLRMAHAGARFKTTDDVLSVYRVTGYNKTSTGGEKRNEEIYQLMRDFNRAGAPRLLTELAYHCLWPLKRLRRQQPRWLYVPMSNAARTTVLLTLGPMLGFERVRRCTHPFF